METISLDIAYRKALPALMSLVAAPSNNPRIVFIEKLQGTCPFEVKKKTNKNEVSSRFSSGSIHWKIWKFDGATIKISSQATSLNIIKHHQTLVVWNINFQFFQMGIKALSFLGLKHQAATKVPTGRSASSWRRCQCRRTFPEKEKAGVHHISARNVGISCDLVGFIGEI